MPKVVDLGPRAIPARVIGRQLVAEIRKLLLGDGFEGCLKQFPVMLVAGILSCHGRRPTYIQPSLLLAGEL